jgi:hypothetical protein
MSVETALEPKPIRKYEIPTRVPWKESNAQTFAEFKDITAKHSLVLPDPLVAFRGGGMLEPAAAELAPSYHKYLAGERPIAVVPMKSEDGGKFEQVVHFPTRKENLPLDANLAAYKLHMGDFVFEHWKRNGLGNMPLVKVESVDTTQDGRYVTFAKYKPGLRGLGKGTGFIGIQEMDTKRITPEETKRLVHVLDAIHPPTDVFNAWLDETKRSIPSESWISQQNPMVAMRGQEWWINETTHKDRLTELSKKMTALESQYKAIDPAFVPATQLESFIRNNIQILPHQNGTVDDPSLAAEMVVAHGTIHPENVQQSTPRDGGTPNYTIVGGDRSHGMGVRGEMIDWLVASAAESPEHQNAMIEEFMKLYPSDKDKRGLAMQVLYRSIMSAPWFASQKKEAELGNVAKLTYDIMQGRGVWEGVHTPLAK